ncbi:MAG: MotA/TolQ/ExbB proton channel family protein [Lachnospiraceae bacterium]|nr:MotA/TolQ/ExbB proton channel family protein [Ruminococcus sp.]MCM1273775.1 MotA/TolQ/ExbB proton channel family protein [Lachnospiraceae bacterium]
MEFLKAVFKPDLISFVILIACVVNVLVFLAVRKNISRLENTVRPKIDRRNGVTARLALTDSESSELAECSGRATGAYALFTNLTAVFPLLGILGTVTSLMRLSGADDLSENFMSALSTTFWGLVCAIGFKIADSFITARLDRALDEADYLVHEHDKEKRVPEEI